MKYFLIGPSTMLYDHLCMHFNFVKYWGFLNGVRRKFKRKYISLLYYFFHTNSSSLWDSLFDICLFNLLCKVWRRNWLSLSQNTDQVIADFFFSQSDTISMLTLRNCHHCSSWKLGQSYIFRYQKFSFPKQKNLCIRSKQN